MCIYFDCIYVLINKYTSLIMNIIIHTIAIVDFVIIVDYGVIICKQLLDSAL